MSWSLRHSDARIQFVLYSVNIHKGTVIFHEGGGIGGSEVCLARSNSQDYSSDNLQEMETQLWESRLYERRKEEIDHPSFL